MGFGEILNSLLMIFAMIIPGILFKKTGNITESQTKGISNIVTKLSLPFLIIDSMQMEFSKEIFKSSIMITFAVLVFFVLAILMALPIAKLTKMSRPQSGIFTFMMIFANTGFIGIPIISALYGKEAIFYASIIEMVNDFCIYTLGIAIIQITSGKKAKINWRDFFSPGVFCILFGYTLFLFNLRLPGFLGSTVRLIGTTTTPLCMFVIGSQLGDIQLKELFQDSKIYIMCFFKLLVFPLAVMLILRLFLPSQSLIADVLIISCSMPAAVATAIFAEQFGSDAPFASKSVLLSTLFCIFTIPIIIFLL